jgi:hypothetical protein
MNSTELRIMNANLKIAIFSFGNYTEKEFRVLCAALYVCWESGNIFSISHGLTDCTFCIFGSFSSQIINSRKAPVNININNMLPSL